MSNHGRCPAEASAYPGGERVPGGPWAAKGSAWGDTETALWQGAGYGTGHRAARAWPFLALARPCTPGCTHPAPAWPCTLGTALGSGVGGAVGSQKPPGWHPVPTPVTVPQPCMAPRGCGTQTRVHGCASHSQTLHELCRAPSCPARGGSIPLSATGVPGGGPSTRSGPAREGSQEHRSRLGESIPAAGRGPAVNFRLELPFVLPSLPVPPAPSLTSAGSKPGPGVAQTHLSCPRAGAKPGAGGLGAAGGAAALPRHRSKPRQGGG